MQGQLWTKVELCPGDVEGKEELGLLELQQSLWGHREVGEEGWVEELRLEEGSLLLELVLELHL